MCRTDKVLKINDDINDGVVKQLTSLPFSAASQTQEDLNRPTSCSTWKTDRIEGPAEDHFSNDF